MMPLFRRGAALLLALIALGSLAATPPVLAASKQAAKKAAPAKTKTAVLSVEGMH